MARQAWAALLLALATVLALVAPGGEPRNDFHFAILGDRTGNEQPGVYERVWREIDQRRPDFVINVGDTIEGGHDETAELEWAEWREDAIEPFKRYPLFLVPGNHDIFSAYSRELWAKVTGRPPHYSFDWQDAHFTVLDNAQAMELSDEQLGFLEADLKTHRAKQPKFIFFHQPFWLLHQMGRSGESALHHLAREHGVEYVISGHGHMFLRRVRDGVTYLQVGSSGAALNRPPKGEAAFRSGHFYHHVFATVKGARVEMIVKELDGRSARVEQWDEHGFEPRAGSARGCISDAGVRRGC